MTKNKIDTENNITFPKYLSSLYLLWVSTLDELRADCFTIKSAQHCFVASNNRKSIQNICQLKRLAGQTIRYPEY